MPARSRTQQRLMGQALAYKRKEIKSKDLDPRYADRIKKLSKSMTTKQLRDFAKTKHKNLPEKVQEHVLGFEQFNEAMKINHEDQKLSSMKKQNHKKSEKPNNSELSSEDHLADKPKVGSYSKPDNKHLSSEEFLAEDPKLKHLKDFKQFSN